MEKKERKASYGKTFGRELTLVMKEEHVSVRDLREVCGMKMENLVAIKRGMATIG